MIREAVAAHADLLVTHHELLYRPLARLDTLSWRGKAIAQAVQNDLTVYAAHTNLDIAQGGVNDVLAKVLGLTHVEILDEVSSERLHKLVVFVPITHAQRVRDAVCDAGAGFTGRYSHCTFTTQGEQTFLPTEGARPFRGKVGELTRSDEVRIETVLPERIMHSVVAAMRTAHPYEEVAYDLFALELQGQANGIGRIGELSGPRRLHDFAQFVRQQLGLTHIRYSGDPNLSVQRIAVLGGAGGRWADKARLKGAQVLVTSDCDHHQVAEAWETGLAIVDATHAALERPVLQKLQQVMLANVEDALDVQVSAVVEDPFTWV